MPGPEGPDDGAVTEALTRLASAARHVLGRPLMATEIDRFGRYLRTLMEWGRVHDLTGLSAPRDIVRTLFLESLLFLPLLPAGPLRLVDVGSGAGFPGIPLHIVAPRITVLLVDARRKRASFLKAIRRSLGLEGATVWHGRAEELPRDQGALAGGFDVVTMRAVAGSSRAMAIARPLLLPHGRLVASLAVGTDPAAVMAEGRRHGMVAEVSTVVVPEEGMRKAFLVSRLDQGYPPSD